MKQHFLLSYLFLCFFVSTSIAARKYSEPVRLSQRYQVWDFPDTIITYKGHEFKCWLAHANFMPDDTTHFAIHVDAQYTHMDNDSAGFVVHRLNDELIAPVKEGMQKIKGKYLVWCFPPITGYNTDLYLHVTAHVNYYDMESSYIKYKLKKKKTRHPYFKISKEIYKTQDWDKCRKR